MTINIFPRAQEQEPWSSVLFGMVNSLKPVKQQQPLRLRAARPPNSDHQHPTNASPSSNHGATREYSVQVVERPHKRQRLSPRDIHPPLARAALSLEAGTSSPRPPAKLTRTEPDGDLAQTINGVRTRLDAVDGEIQQDPQHAVIAQHVTDAQGRPQRAAQKSQDKRTLRSHDEGSRLKSDLSIYFPDYEDIINDVPREPELLTPDTVIHLINEPLVSARDATRLAKSQKPEASASKHYRQTSLNFQTAQQTAAHKLNGAQIVDFSTIEKSVPHHPQDPLTDAVYFKPHRRAERKEKQLRNIEKERAMHEKLQLERLLQGLQGHDWLRVLGITGVTDSEAKKYEPKRDYFIAEVDALVTKFKEWKEEEKRLRLEKEAALLAKEEEGEDEDAEGEEGDSESEPSSSDVDASAARQLQLEASGGGSKSKPRRAQQPAAAPPPPPIIYRPPSPQGPFLSFFAKPHIRAAALGKQRHGRNVLAFGLPIPEAEEKEFKLPGDLTTPEALKESARRRRRMKRESLVDRKAG